MLHRQLQPPSFSPPLYPTAMGKGKTLRLKIAFVRAMMSRASMVGGGGLALAPSFLQLNPPPPPLQPTSELQPGCSAPCPCHLQRPIYSPPPQSQTHSQGISPWIRQHWGKDATPGKTGRYSKPFTSRAQPRASPLHRDAPLHTSPGPDAAPQLLHHLQQTHPPHPSNVSPLAVSALYCLAVLLQHRTVLPVATVTGGDPLPHPQHGTTVSLGAGGCRSCSGPRTGT